MLKHGKYNLKPFLHGATSGYEVFLDKRTIGIVVRYTEGNGRPGWRQNADKSRRPHVYRSLETAIDGAVKLDKWQQQIEQCMTTDGLAQWLLRKMRP